MTISAVALARSVYQIAERRLIPEPQCQPCESLMASGWASGQAVPELAVNSYFIDGHCGWARSRVVEWGV